MAAPSLQLQYGLTFEDSAPQYQLSKLAPLTTATEKHSQPLSHLLFLFQPPPIDLNLFHGVISSMGISHPVKEPSVLIPFLKLELP